MFYTDKVHLIAGDKTTIQELHDFANWIGLKRCYFHGVRKGHPHYDLTTDLMICRVLVRGVKVVSSKEIVQILKEKYSK